MDRFFIAPYDKTSGLQTNVRPWLIPDEAFSKLNNAYVFRGRVRKRFGSRWLLGSQLLTRLRIGVGNYSIPLTGGAGVGITDGAGSAMGTVPGGLYQVGQRFVIGTELFTVVSGLPGPQVMTTTGASVTHTYDITNGNYVFAGAAINTQIYFFPNTLTTDGAGNINALVPPPYNVGQMFSIGNQVFTVNALGNPATLLISGTATLATFDTTTGQVIINGAAANTALFFYPALPVMGLLSYDTNDVNNEPTIGFDTKYAYIYTVGWDRISAEYTPGAATWTGSNSQFFWSTTWTGATGAEKILFVTNFNQNEPNFMRYYDGSAWDNFKPLINATDSLFSTRILVVFKNRLVALNTWEGLVAPGLNYQSRARYSQIGSPLDVDGWKSSIPGRGNAIDAATTEAIITAEFIKDRLIVYFERSTWELVYTGNQIYPFTWQQINTELGAESTFSVIPFDKVAIGVGNVGIHACNGSNVDRIDSNIPDTVFEIHNADAGVNRVYGIRDYYVEMLYWTFPDVDASADFPFPSRVLVYNYKTSTWSFNDDSITAFGYFQSLTGITWDSTTVTWDDEVSWDDGSAQPLFRQVIAGNQQGWTFIVDSEEPTNAPALQITDIVNLGGNIIQITAINHNLRLTDYVYLENITGTGNLNLLNNKIYYVTTDFAFPNVFTVIYYDPDDPDVVIAGTYAGGGTVRRMSVIDMRTKEYNFYADKGRNASIMKVDFLVDTTPPEAKQQLEIDFYLSTSELSMVSEGQASNSILGTGNLETFPYPTVPLELNSTRVWHPVYLQADGECIQLQIVMNQDQMMTVIPITNPDDTISYTGPAFVDFQLHAMCFTAMSTSYRLQ